MGVADFMYENDFFYAETPVPDVKFHVWNIQIHTSIQQRQNMNSPPPPIHRGEICLKVPRSPNPPIMGGISGCFAFLQMGMSGVFC